MNPFDRADLAWSRFVLWRILTNVRIERKGHNPSRARSPTERAVHKSRYEGVIRGPIMCRTADVARAGFPTW